MYVCICNGVTEDDVRGCIAAGAETTREVRAACGMKPGCGVCTRRLHSMIREHCSAGEQVDALAGCAGAAPAESATGADPFTTPAERLADQLDLLPAASGAPCAQVALGMPAMPSAVAR